MILKTFLKQSVIIIPVITFSIGIMFFNKELLLLAIYLIISIIFNTSLKIFFGKINYNKFLRPNVQGKTKNITPIDCIHNIGMPSCHSQIAWTFTSFMTVVIYTNQKIPSIHKWIYYIILFLLAISISISRTGLILTLGPKVHTISQVAIGSILGLILGTIMGILIYIY